MEQRLRHAADPEPDKPRKAGADSRREPAGGPTSERCTDQIEPAERQQRQDEVNDPWGNGESIVQRQGDPEQPGLPRQPDADLPAGMCLPFVAAHDAGVAVGVVFEEPTPHDDEAQREVGRPDPDERQPRQAGSDTRTVTRGRQAERATGPCRSQAGVGLHPHAPECTALALRGANGGGGLLASRQRVRR